MKAGDTAPPKNPTFEQQVGWLEKALKFKAPLPKPNDGSEKPPARKTTGEKPEKQEVPPLQSAQEKQSDDAKYRQKVRDDTDNAAAAVVPGLEVVSMKAATCLPANDAALTALQTDLQALATARQSNVFSANEPELAKFNFAAEQVGKLTAKAQASGEAAKQAVEKEEQRRDAARKDLSEHSAQKSIKDYAAATAPALPRLKDGADRAKTIEPLLTAVSDIEKNADYTGNEAAHATFESLAATLKQKLAECGTAFTGVEEALRTEQERRTQSRKTQAEHAAQKPLKEYAAKTAPALPRLETGAELAKTFEGLLNAVGTVEKNADYSGNEASHTNFEKLAVQLKDTLDKTETAFTETTEALRVEAEKRAKKADELKKAAQERQTKATGYAQQIRDNIPKNAGANQQDAMQKMAVAAEKEKIKLQPVVDLAPAELPYADYQAKVRNHEELLKKFDDTVEKKYVSYFKIHAVSTDTNTAHGENKKALDGVFGVVAGKQLQAAKDKMSTAFQEARYDDALQSADAWKKLVAEAPEIVDAYKKAVANCDSTLSQINKIITKPKEELNKKKAALQAEVGSDLANANKNLLEFGKLVRGITYLSGAYRDYLNDDEVENLFKGPDKAAGASIRDKVQKAVTTASLDFPALQAEIEAARKDAAKANKIRAAFNGIRDQRGAEIDNDAVLTAHPKTRELVKEAHGEISASELGFEGATRQLNALPGLVSIIKGELNRLDKITLDGAARCKDVFAEFSHKLTVETINTEKEIAKRANSPSSTAGEKALGDLETTYDNIAAFAAQRSELESVHHYTTTQKNAFPPEQKEKLAKLYKDFNESATSLKFAAVKQLGGQLAVLLEVTAKSSADLRRADRLCKEAPPNMTAELKKLYAEGVKQVASGKDWNASGLDETLNKCQAQFPNLFEAAAKKMNQDMTQAYAAGVQQGDELAPFDAKLKPGLEVAWKTAEQKVKDAKYEEALPAFDTVKAQLETLGHAHVKLPFLTAWDQYQTEWKRVNIPAGVIQKKVQHKADDIELTTRGQVVEASVIKKAKTDIDQLKGKLDDHAKFETAYPTTKGNYDNLLAQKPHSKQQKRLEDLHKEADDRRENDPTQARVKLAALDALITSVTNKMVNFKAVNVPRPAALAGGSGFETAADEGTAKNLALNLIEDGGITLANVATMVPPATPNSFAASTKYPTGFKYAWVTASGVSLEIYGHGPTVNAKVSADSDNKKGNVLRVKINGKYLRPNGDLTAKATDATSHMSLF
jgi:hypothetical protein